MALFLSFEEVLDLDQNQDPSLTKSKGNKKVYEVLNDTLLVHLCLCNNILMSLKEMIHFILACERVFDFPKHPNIDIH